MFVFSFLADFFREAWVDIILANGSDPNVGGCTLVIVQVGSLNTELGGVKLTLLSMVNSVSCVPVFSPGGGRSELNSVDCAEAYKAEVFMIKS